MVASQKTINSVIDILGEWSEDHRVDNGEVYSLLEDLSEVPGNKSFTETIKKVMEGFKEF